MPEYNSLPAWKTSAPEPVPMPKIRAADNTVTPKQPAPDSTENIIVGLSEALERLSKNLADLEGRLNPVLGPVGPPCEERCEADTGHQSVLNIKLLGLHDTVRAIHAHVNNIHTRIRL